MNTSMRKSAIGLLSATAAMGLASAHAVSLTITVENTQTVSANGNGLSLTPVWFSFLDTSQTFDAFDVGANASAAVEEIAEVGSFGQLDDAVDAAQSDGITGAVIAPGGVAPTIDPGETGVFVVEVDPFANDWFQFLSMVVPTNDTFVGNDAPVDLFDDDGVFFGTQTFDLTLANTYDAGTEDNVFLEGAAFLANVDGSTGITTSDPIGAAQATDFSAELLADGLTFLDPVLAAAFFSGNTTLGTVTISLTPTASPVPVPGAALLFGSMLAGGGILRRRRKAA
ncbi:MAG: spondin domain-containing protein [Pseudomonadota bacterium]